MFGQIPDFTNGFEFMRKLWGSGAGLSGSLMPGLQAAMTPPMDLEDLDKRIHDLKAVESWLQLNTNLLHTTIQGLEVQRATLVALQTFGNALSPEAMQNAMESVARAANAPSASPSPSAQRPAASDKPADAAAASAQEAAEPGAQAGSGKSADTAPPPNASLWWDMLQQQFNQIASGAAAASIAPFGMSGFATGTPAAAAKPDEKPAANPAGTDKSASGPARKSGTAPKGATKDAAKSTAARKKPSGAGKAAKPDNGNE
ncbi:hypothetical protein CupriaWKF_00630 [Cupriavidus sp. WKF15]|uniref:PhaM family polyhydroxyalkanoate granule multifunctional regulatory protein n=1 Tax=Cupriavidus sp. WKF15 TaxID=3032282 RepID=UPI0023E2E94B|nr:PhaM family polyhydroxyalkanoate granule multifunctional regulatory protein [Cupriavidus sp. WKF15]WER46131.1 hypothetical protein CupriaWKF_00630 [Cupriavidus sp. WKF15]